MRKECGLYAAEPGKLNNINSIHMPSFMDVILNINSHKV